MTTSKIAEQINQPRRNFIGAAAVTAAAAQLGMIGKADAQPAKTKLPAIKPGARTSFGPLKQIDAGVLNVAYAEAGPADGPPVILLHGWPYDIYAFVDVAPLLASAGYRVLIPYLRGYGATRFLSSEAIRNGQPSALAADIIAFMDALKIEKAILAGFDWGARTANIVAALWPERVKAMVSVSGYLIGSQEAGKMPLPPKAELRMVVPVLFCHRARPRRLRQIPARVFEADLADRFAEMAFRRRHVRSQRRRLRQPGPRRHRRSITIAGGLASPKARRSTTNWRSGLPQVPVIAVPTITLEGDANGAPHPEPSAYAKKFSGKYSHRLIKGGIGHNLPQEAPKAFAEAIIDVAEA